MSGVARYVGATIVAALAVGGGLSGCHHEPQPLHTRRAHACAQWGGEYTYTPQTDTYSCQFASGAERDGALRTKTGESIEPETPRGMCDPEGGVLSVAPGVDGRYVCTVTR